LVLSFWSKKNLTEKTTVLKAVSALRFSHRYVQWIIFAGFIVTQFIGQYLLAVGNALFAVSSFFAFNTLPVEYDGSNRALAWLDGANIAGG